MFLLILNTITILVQNYKIKAVFFFFPRVIRIWNHLPAQAVNTKGTDNFKEAALPVLRLMQPPVGSSIL